MHMIMDQICYLITKLIEQKKVEFLYRYDPESKYCVINDTVLEFYEQEEGSFRVHYQGFDFLWIRETPGWDVVSRALANVVADDADEDRLYGELYKRVFSSLNNQLIEYSNETR